MREKMQKIDNEIVESTPIPKHRPGALLFPP